MTAEPIAMRCSAEQCVDNNYCVLKLHVCDQGLLESRVSRVTRPAGELHDLAE